MLNTEAYRVKPRTAVRLLERPSNEDGGLDKDRAQSLQKKLSKRLSRLQELLYADGRYGLLVVLQAMDTGGKDSTIRQVFAPVNPQGCRVASFKVPSEAERRHDFLWRIHQQAPERGHIAVFNRSHYEDVLVVRVKGLAPEEVWRARYQHINAFERLLHDENTRVVKFYLHISRDYQRQRLQKRLDDPGKHWKFSPADLAERQRWDQYMQAYEDALSRCSTSYAPWYIIPAEKRLYRDLLISKVLVDTIRRLKLRYPEPGFDPRQIVIPE